MTALVSRSARRTIVASLAIGWSAVASACGGVASEESTRPVASAGAASELDAGADAATQTDASSASDAGVVTDAGDCLAERASCCDGWTGASSHASCNSGSPRCFGAHDRLQFDDDECSATPDVCHVESTQDLSGKMCAADSPVCHLGTGCTSCVCACGASSGLWECECVLC